MWRASLACERLELGLFSGDLCKAMGHDHAWDRPLSHYLRCHTLRKLRLVGVRLAWICSWTRHTGALGESFSLGTTWLWFGTALDLAACGVRPCTPGWMGDWVLFSPGVGTYSGGPSVDGSTRRLMRSPLWEFTGPHACALMRKMGRASVGTHGGGMWMAQSAGSHPLDETPRWPAG